MVVFVSDFGSPFFACLPVGSWLSFCVDNLFLMIFSYSSPACCGPGQFVPHPFVQPVLFLLVSPLLLGSGWVGIGDFGSYVFGALIIGCFPPVFLACVLFLHASWRAGIPKTHRAN